MSTIWTLLRATAVVAGSSAALLIGGLMGTAHADPAPRCPHPISASNCWHRGQAPAGAAKPRDGPGRTARDAAAVGQRIDQVAARGRHRVHPARAQPRSSPARARRRDYRAPALGIPGLTPTVPAATAPTTGIPGLTSPVPAASTPLTGLPGLTPTVPAAAPATGPAGLLPQAQLNLPQLPFLGVPLPQQISLPGDLTSLFTGGSPLTSLASAAGCRLFPRRPLPAGLRRRSGGSRACHSAQPVALPGVRLALTPHPAG